MSPLSVVYYVLFILHRLFLQFESENPTNHDRQEQEYCNHVMLLHFYREPPP